MAWWREARFGMFIHCGVYSVPAGTYKDKPVGGIDRVGVRSLDLTIDTTGWARSGNGFRK